MPPGRYLTNTFMGILELHQKLLSALLPLCVFKARRQATRGKHYFFLAKRSTHTLNVF